MQMMMIVIRKQIPSLSTTSASSSSESPSESELETLTVKIKVLDLVKAAAAPFNQNPHDSNFNNFFSIYGFKLRSVASMKTLTNLFKFSEFVSLKLLLCSRFSK
ncbi:hypothetical protein HanIR_Chr02g0083181 [Helianthus annuus]|nr:hypothetical protein HanIR_Chr02g0083181 [Helianthus annuus]